MPEVASAVTLVQPLWDGEPPYGSGREPEDRPFVEVYLPEREIATGAAMLIFPGGAYTFLSDRSGKEYARWLTSAGIAGIVVNSRLGSHGYRYPAILSDAQRAFVVTRAHAERWGIDPDRLGVIGTSAGGHLASLVLTEAGAPQAPGWWKAGPAPQLGVLCYPVISLCEPLAHQETRANFLGDEAHRIDLQQRYSSQLRVSAQTPPCFVWHTNPDQEVGVDNSWVFTQALRTHGVPFELHLYGSGPHALGLARDHQLFWSDECLRWLRGYGF